MSWQQDTDHKWAGGEKCYHKHPPLKVDEYFIYGGSCGSPVVDDADIYVGLDWNMAEHKQSYPWYEGETIHFKITDMKAPSDAVEFKNLIIYITGAMQDKQKVHVGCIGGHGRTGVVMAAVVATMTDEEDPITYVRTHYCKKAVESKAQIQFLMKHYGCKEVKGTKEHKPAKPTRETPQVVDPVKSPAYLWGNNKINS